MPIHGKGIIDARMGKTAASTPTTALRITANDAAGANSVSALLQGNTLRNVTIKGFKDSSGHLDLSGVMLQLGTSILQSWSHSRSKPLASECKEHLTDHYIHFENPDFKRGQVQPIDYVLHSKSTFVWDVGLIYGVGFKCPCCPHSMFQRNGNSTSARLIKGLGGRDKDVYVVTKRWECKNAGETLVFE